jgi:hypothetical protein
MAYSKPPVKSQAISEHLAANPESSPLQIVEALKQKGIEVSFGLANKVKYGKGKKKASVKKAMRAAAVKAEPVVTGSESIRQYLAKNPTAGTKDVITALHEQRIDVSESLVHKVKSRSSGKRAKTRRKPAFSTARSQKVTVSKSESIRDYLRRHPDAAPKVVRAGLWKEGVRVATSLISNVAFYFRKKNAAPSVKVAARKVPAKTSRKTATTGVSIEQLLEVKRFADTFGGADQVRSALDTLAKLR